jgi:hypothetical protein
MPEKFVAKHRVSVVVPAVAMEMPAAGDAESAPEPVNLIKSAVIALHPPALRSIASTGVAAVPDEYKMLSAEILLLFAASL